MARFLTAGVLVVSLTWGCAGATVAWADTSTSGTPGLPTLKDTLEKGLKARRPEEFAFIAKVVKLVDDGTLPLSLVDSTFLWARKKDIHEFQYFQQGLKIRAQKIGLEL